MALGHSTSPGSDHARFLGQGLPLEALAALQAEDLEADVAPAGGLGGDVDEASVRTRR
jgi:hypothetical protein